MRTLLMPLKRVQILLMGEFGSGVFLTISCHWWIGILAHPNILCNGNYYGFSNDYVWPQSDLRCMHTCRRSYLTYRELVSAHAQRMSPRSTSYPLSREISNFSLLDCWQKNIGRYSTCIDRKVYIQKFYYSAATAKSENRVECCTTITELVIV